ncbi:DNA-binding FadR family transcriptional regulator [Roseibium hamelinense]|uniref:DNA-binding FadR family transcriptional regulator n=1 Tax=Roseibium hamelinense TaxID=150831 RepID=A0A562SUL4_9HYPH|nr:FCD domain-containing protein [Roseibium hamelinense]MTI43183.1 FadR family transcriptional regulator [Roseibium hamelinense]TWI84768.1 DNA-binding FadR family transcriptional regulator [Roseibium hamelinense]
MTASDGSPDVKTRKRLRRPDALARKIREQIVEAGLKPGDRLPNDWLAPEMVKVSRGTLREALKVLEFQGLITSRSGPGGGVFVAAVEPGEAIRLLDNLFLFKPPSISDIYTLRKQLEPELAASVAGHLTETAFQSLQSCIRLYEDEPETAEQEYAQRLAELDFHEELTRHCPNPILAFTCSFLLSLLRDMTVCRSIYWEKNPSLRETGLHYQVRLLRAIKVGDAELCRMIMRGHMIEAEKFMLERAAMRGRSAEEPTTARTGDVSI